MSDRRYTLELTADEIELLYTTQLAGRAGLREVRFKLAELEQQARADREAEDLRLPWIVGKTEDGIWVVRNSARTWPSGCAAVRLMAAAPALLEAVKAMLSLVSGSQFFAEAKRISARALGKVETGQPEEG